MRIGKLINAQMPFANLGLNLEVLFMDFVNLLPVVENLLAFDKAEFFCTRMVCA